MGNCELVFGVTIELSSSIAVEDEKSTEKHYCQKHTCIPCSHSCHFVVAGYLYNELALGLCASLKPSYELIHVSLVFIWVSSHPLLEELKVVLL